MANLSLLVEIEADIEKALICLDKYEHIIEEADPLFNLEDVKLETLCREQPGWLAKHYQYEQELKAVENILQIKRDEIEGKLWKKYVEGYSRQLSSTEIKNYVMKEKDMVDISLIMNEISFVKNKMSAVVDGFRSMGFALKNIVALRVNQLQNEIL